LEFVPDSGEGEFVLFDISGDPATLAEAKD
jgi:hypothetical protein